MGTRAVGMGSGVTTPALRRPRLLSLLDDATERRLTTIVAPAGYGKTSLLAEWTASHDHSTAWLSLRRVHNRSRRLAADLTAAFDVLASAPFSVLVLDDFHVLTDDAALDECAAFIERAPDTLHVVLTSRIDLPHRYYRLRFLDSLAEVGVDDLRFTRDEVAELLPAPRVDAAMACTKGWALGLKLFAEDRSADDYLTAEILNLQSDDLRAFLLSTSILEPMSGPLCDFVIAGHRSQARLEDLQSSGAFVTSLDARKEWFAYHPMFRSVLRQMLREAEGAREPALLHRAAEWHLRRGEVEDGVRYLIEAGADDEVVEAAFTHASTMFEHHRTAEVAGWIEGAPSASRQGATSVALLEAAALIFGDEPRAVRKLLDAVEAMPGVSRGERVVADLLRAFFEVGEGIKVTAIAASDRVLAAVDAVDEAGLPNLFGLTGSRTDLKAGALVARAVARLYDGELSAARIELESVDDGVHGIWRSTALGALSLVEAWSGNLTRAEELANRALSLADSLGHDARSRTTAWLALAFVARRRNDLDRAATLLDDVERSGAADRRIVATWVASERARIALASDISPAGLAALAGQLVSAHPSLPTGVLARRWAAEAQLLIVSGDLEAAEQIAELGLEAGSSELMSSRVRLAVERVDLVRARALVANWPDGPQPRAGRERRLWTAVLDHLEGDEDRACKAMGAVVAEAETEGDVGLFQAAGTHALGPVRALYRAAPSAFLRALVNQPFIVGHATPAKGLAEQLTDREYMVLVHLPSRRSNAEIAERLGVSLNTVKTHLKHIYRKLGVVGRSDAVEAAERLRLL